MAHESQRGATLVEAAVSIAIVAIVAGTVLSAALTATRNAGTGIDDALHDAAARELEIARDVMKYQGATLVPASVATTLPMPAGSPIAATLTLQTAASHGTTTLTIVAVAKRSGRRVAIAAQLRPQAPLPGTQLRVPGLAPAPTGAP